MSVVVGRISCFRKTVERTPYTLQTFFRVFEECGLCLEMRELLRAIMCLLNASLAVSGIGRATAMFISAFSAALLTALLLALTTSPRDLPHFPTLQSKTLPSTHLHLFFLLPQGLHQPQFFSKVHFTQKASCLPSHTFAKCFSST